MLSFDLITFQKPQINFQSDDTNGRLVLAAAEAEVQGAGFPLLASPVRVQPRRNCRFNVIVNNEYLKLLSLCLLCLFDFFDHLSLLIQSEPEPDDICPDAAPAQRERRNSSIVSNPSSRDRRNSSIVSIDSSWLESSDEPTMLGYYKREISTVMQGATVFVAPMDVDMDAGVLWVPDNQIIEDPKALKVPVMQAKSHHKTTSLLGIDIADIERECRFESQIQGAGLLRRIVEPCPLYFNWTYDCPVNGLVKKAIERKQCSENFRFQSSSPSVQDAMPYVQHDIHWKRQLTQVRMDMCGF